MNTSLIEERKNLLQEIHNLEEKQTEAFKDMDFESFCDYSATISKQRKRLARLDELIVDF